MGGQRGRLITQEERQNAICLIEEAKNEGARISKACDCLEISVRTFKRWKSGRITDQRKGADKSIPKKLTAKERQAIIDACCSTLYVKIDDIGSLTLTHEASSSRVSREGFSSTI